MKTMLRVGTAEVDITPPVGHPLAGFHRKEFGYREIDSRCFARALTLEPNSSLFLIEQP